MVEKLLLIPILNGNKAYNLNMLEQRVLAIKRIGFIIEKQSDDGRPVFLLDNKGKCLISSLYNIERNSIDLTMMDELKYHTFDNPFIQAAELLFKNKLTDNWCLFKHNTAQTKWNNFLNERLQKQMI